MTFFSLVIIFVTIFIQKVVFRLLALPSDSWIMNWLSFALIFAIISLIFENIYSQREKR